LIRKGFSIIENCFHGCSFFMERFNFYAEVSDVLAENPEVVIVAAGGLPNTEFLRDGADLVIPSWDILAGTVKVEKNI